MSDAKSAGRVVGVLFLLQGFTAPIANFVLMRPATDLPGFLANAAANATQVNMSAILRLVSGVLWIGIAIAALPVFRRYSERLALCFLALTAVCLSGLILEAAGVRSMVALSEAYANAGRADAAAFEAAAAVSRSIWTSAHYVNVLLSGVALLVMYTTLIRFALIPRALSVLGLLTVGFLIAGALIPLFGHRVQMWMFTPMGVSQLALVLWLLVRGFAQQPPSPVTAQRE